MKFKNIIIALFLVLFYSFNSNVIEWIYPLAKTDYYEFLKYYDLRNQVYSIVFFLTFLYLFYTNKGLTKALFTFLMFVSFASMVDKCVYNIYEFKAMDWIVITAGIMGGIYVFIKENGTNQ